MDEAEGIVPRLQDLERYRAYLTYALGWIQDHAGKDPRSVNELVAQVIEGRLEPYAPLGTLFDPPLAR